MNGNQHYDVYVLNCIDIWGWEWGFGKWLYPNFANFFYKCPVFDLELQFKYLRIVKVFCVDCFFFYFYACVFVFACLKELS